MDASVEVTAQQGLEVTGPSDHEVTGHEGPRLSHVEQVVWSLLQLDPRLTRRTDQARLRRLARLLDQSPEEVLIALERLRTLARQERVDPSAFKSRYHYPPPAQRAAKALAEIFAQCGGGRVEGAAARGRLADLLDALGHAPLVAEAHASAVSLPSLPNLGPPTVPIKPWPSDARSALGVGAFTMPLSPAKARLLALLHLDPRLTRHLHNDRLRLLLELFDPAMEQVAIKGNIDAWRACQDRDPFLKRIFSQSAEDDPARSDAERLVKHLGPLCGWGTLTAEALRIRHHRALMLFGHLP